MFDYIAAFVVGGFICFIGQMLMDVGKLSPIHTLSTLVVAGALLDGYHLYDRLIDFAGAGATVPITSFGHSLVHGAMTEGERFGFFGVGMGVFEITSVGISSTILFSFLVAMFLKPRG
ncbi:stage V sporulation protein AE [bacterium LRH843]|nr:stage V sporulation protein AE [bacterium LRH843]